MRTLLVVLACLLPVPFVSAAPPASAGPAAARPARPAPAPRVEALAWPGSERAQLEIPPEIWEAVVATGALPAGPPGYTFEQMRPYGRDRALLRTVETLFRDARGLPRFAGRVTDEMLAAAMPDRVSLGELVRQAHVLTDVSAARFFPGPSRDSWGVDWLPPDAPGDVALPLILDRLGGTGRAARSEREALLALPDGVQRMIARVLVGADTAAPWLRRAIEDAIPPGASRAPAGRARGTRGPTLSFDDAYRLATAPWKDEFHDQVATSSRESLRLLDLVDRQHHAYGAVIFLLHVDVGLAELREWAATPAGRAALATSPARVDAATPFGPVRVFGVGDDVHHESRADADDPLAGPAFFAIDLGGNDRWIGRHGVNDAPRRPIGLAVDLSGNDSWEGGESPATFGCGLFGLGVVIDVEGDDRWRVSESGLGAGWFGTGVLADLAGNDTYVVDGSWGQGAGHVGVGLLLDVAGNDSYECAQQSQGLGSTLGAGVLIDISGDDRYVARDDGNVSPLYLGQSVAMAQGCGYGRRADLGDGHSLAGGVGILLDAAGDDFYHAQVWAQGVGYWWGLGILEDRAGNDTYENGKYSAGAAAHFALGSFVDLAGDDRYSQGVTTAVNQYHGHARDGSIGVAIDGDGNDRYFFKSHCGGSGDLGSVGLFWDRRGDDVYEVSVEGPEQPDGWAGTPPMGSATFYPPYRSWRDELPTLGIFLDTGGKDTYPAAGPAKDGATWTRRNPPASHGLGIDGDWYPTPPRPPVPVLAPSTSAPR